MPQSSFSAPRQAPPPNPSGAGPNFANPIQLPIPGSGILPTTANWQGSQRSMTPRSITPTFPVPQRHGTEPAVTGTPPTTYPLRPIQSAPGFPVPQPLPFIGSHVATSSNVQQGQGSSATSGKALLQSLVYTEGEIPVFDKDDVESWTLTRSEPVVTLERISTSWYKIWKWFSSRKSWTDAHGILLDSHFVVVKKETSPTEVVKKETSPTGVVKKETDPTGVVKNQTSPTGVVNAKKETNPSGAVEEETSPARVDKTTLVYRPIPLEHLSLASFSDDPEDRKYPQGFFKQIGSCVHLSSGPKKEQVYPFTVYHAAAKITRRHTVYTKTKTDRNKWNVALEQAIESRKSQQHAQMLYAPQVFNDGFFKVPPRIRFNREARYTGRVTCAALFAFQWDEFPQETREDYIAIGCTTGVYVSKRTERTEDYLFRKILEFNEPSSIIAIPEYHKLLVHCESTLSSFPLDKVIRASRAVQGDAAIKDLGASEEKLSKDEEHVLFLKAGCLVEKTADPNQNINRIVVIYAVKNSEDKITSHVLELKRDGGASKGPGKYQPLGPSFTIPEEPHDATCFVNKVAICTSKAIYFVEPLTTINPPPEPQMVPRVAKEAHEKSKLPWPFKKGKDDKPKIVEMVGNASVLGMVAYDRDRDYLLVYDNLGCFVDEGGKPARTDYYIEWERKATSFARHGPYILLVSPGYIEVRNIDTGRLFRMVEVNELRLLRSGLMEGQLLVGVMTGGAESDGSRTEKLVELKYYGV